MESFESVMTGDDKGEILPEKPTVEKTETISEERIREVMEKGQKMIDSYGKFFSTFAKDVSLKFVLSNGYYIKLKEGEIHMDAADFAEKDMNVDEILWSAMHEMAHFIDLTDDPDGLLGSFDHIKDKTKALSNTVLKKLADAKVATPETLNKLTERPEPEEDGEEKLTKLEMALYKIYHTFYNCLDDVYVNNIVSRKAPKFEKNRKGGKEIRDLYRDKLFKNNDYSNLPRHLQFAYKFLRDEMVDDEEVITSDEVKEVFEREVEFEGKIYSLREIIDNFIIPKTKRNTKPGRRYKVIQQTLEPIFEELLQKDLDDWDPKNQDNDQGEGEEGEQEGDSSDKNEGGEGDKQENEDEESGEDQESEQSGSKQKNGSDKKGKKPNKKSKKQKDPNGDDYDPNPFEEDYEEFQKNNPDKISEKDLRKYVEKIKEEKKEKEEKEDSEESDAEVKARKAQEKLDIDWAQKNNVDLNTLREFRQIERSIEPYLEELSILWRDIVLGSSTAVNRDREGGFKTGSLNIPDVIQQWPEIEKRNLDNVRVMDRDVEKLATVEKPELIRVRVVGDLSGSMFEDQHGFLTTAKNAEKIKILKQALVLILSSLKEFNTYLNMNRAVTKSKLEVDTEARVFGDGNRKIKKTRKESGLDEEQARIVEAISHMNDDLGSTYDNFVLGEIRDSLSKEDIEKIKNKKVLEIVFEITDGVSSAPELTTKAINDLDKLGVVIRAFQIGVADRRAQELFRNTWDTKEKKRGQVVGTEIGNLIPAITSALKEYLKNVRI